MASRKISSGASFVERHGLWTSAQERSARAVEAAIKKHKLELVRFSFADQHGVLRGKTVVASEATKLLRAGVSMTTTLLAKDTSHRTVFPVFTAGGGFGMPEMQGGGDFVMVADPATFRILPWAEKTGWVLCDIYFTNGKPVPFSTRQIARDALATLGKAGFDFLSGLEVEFHLFKIENPRLPPADATWPGEPADVSLVTQGFQYLTETRFDQIDSVLGILRKGIEALGLPLRSLEIELGPSQCEFTFGTETGLASADMMVLFRSAMKQIARRHGYLVSFMCRPGLPNMFSSGWHLHQSLIDKKNGKNVFVSADGKTALSPLGTHYLSGLLAHARAAAAFTTPTINGYKRVGEPMANPYLYMASQIYAGLDGIAKKSDPGPSADAPYEMKADPLPKNLGEALNALRADTLFAEKFGAGFIDYYCRIKDAEIARFLTQEKDNDPEVTRWEQKEYFDFF
jgi:glutamine synthetase